MFAINPLSSQVTVRFLRTVSIVEQSNGGGFTTNVAPRRLTAGSPVWSASAHTAGWTRAGNPTVTVRILRLPQVCEVAGLCRSVIYKMEGDLRFPQRVKIGTRAVGWLKKEANAWLMRRIATSRQNSAPV